MTKKEISSLFVNVEVDTVLRIKHSSPKMSGLIFLKVINYTERIFFFSGSTCNNISYIEKIMIPVSPVNLRSLFLQG